MPLHRLAKAICAVIFLQTSVFENPHRFDTGQRPTKAKIDAMSLPLNGEIRQGRLIWAYEWDELTSSAHITDALPARFEGWRQHP